MRDWLKNPPDKIVLYPDPILRQQTKPIEINEDFDKVCAIMFELMYANKGIGLAAPQVGLPYQLFVININGKECVFANPVLSIQGNRKIVHEEGCLSLPGVKGLVERPRTIRIEYEDRKGKKVNQFDGLFSRVIQHEVDHILGILFIDKLYKGD
jgi:peptide deformylase